MTTLVMQKAGGVRLRGMFSSPVGEWILTDGKTEVATVRNRATSHHLDIETGGRTFSAEMPGLYRAGENAETEFTVTDAATGEPAIEGARDMTYEQDKAREKWTVTFASGTELTWWCRTEPYEMGFYDSAGNAVMTVGHNIPWDYKREVERGGGTARTLLRFWGAAVESSMQYGAVYDEQAITSVLPAADVPLLAVVGIWMGQRWDPKGDVGFGFAA